MQKCIDKISSGSAKVASGDSDSADIEPDGGLPPHPGRVSSQ